MNWIDLYLNPDFYTTVFNSTGVETTASKFEEIQFKPGMHISFNRITQLLALQHDWKFECPAPVAREMVQQEIFGRGGVIGIQGLNTRAPSVKASLLRLDWPENDDRFPEIIILHDLKAFIQDGKPRTNPADATSFEPAMTASRIYLAYRRWGKMFTVSAEGFKVYLNHDGRIRSTTQKIYLGYNENIEDIKKFIPINTIEWLEPGKVELTNNEFFLSVEDQFCFIDMEHTAYAV